MYEDIRPYDDVQTTQALRRVSNNPLMDRFSAFLFPGKDPDILKNTLNTVSGVDDFQRRVMCPAIGSIISKTTRGLSYDGLQHFSRGRRYLMLSNHRDIVLDPAFIQYVFNNNDLPFSEIAAGDNLLANQFVEDLMRSNRMVKVIRSSNPREVYQTSKILSSYIRGRLTDPENPSSIWIAHRNGRAKNGDDRTEQGLLKMISMSGGGSFVDDMKEVSIMPVSISYEIESCAIQKAYETYLKGVMGKYLKRPGEDIKSIITGVVQEKGRVHISFCPPITEDELRECDALEGNEKFRRLAEIIDGRILDGYRIWPTNETAAAILLGTEPPEPEISKWFNDYLDRKMKEVSGVSEPAKVRENLIRIFATPALRKKGALV